MALSTIPGYPRIGARRELKRAVEGYWDGDVGREELEETARSLRLEAWTRMRDAGIDLIPSNTFSYYDHVLDTIAMVGAAPPRYAGGDGDLDTYFAMARGAQGDRIDVTALEMVKWFDTNYHYLVPELSPATRFRLANRKPLDEYLEARAAGIETMPVLLGPVSFLLLARGFDADGNHDDDFDLLSLLPDLLDVYAELLTLLSEAGAEWVQFDEPVLVQDRTPEELAALTRAYERLAAAAGSTKLLVNTYFGDVDEAYRTLAELPVAAIGLDLVRGRRNLGLLQRFGLPGGKHVVAGVVDGRNVWLNDLGASLATLREIGAAVGEDRVIVGASCSLLHVPIELDLETDLDPELRSWLAFANQKIEEVAVLGRALDDPNAAADELAANRSALESRRNSPRTFNPAVRERVDSTTAADYDRHGSVEERRMAQRTRLDLPPFPTTTIGSSRRHRRSAGSDGVTPTAASPARSTKASSKPRSSRWSGCRSASASTCSCMGSPNATTWSSTSASSSMASRSRASGGCSRTARAT